MGAAGQPQCSFSWRGAPSLVLMLCSGGLAYCAFLSLVSLSLSRSIRLLSPSASVRFYHSFGIRRHCFGLHERELFTSIIFVTSHPTLLSLSAAFTTPAQAQLEKALYICLHAFLLTRKTGTIIDCPPVAHKSYKVTTLLHPRVGHLTCQVVGQATDQTTLLLGRGRGSASFTTFTGGGCCLFP